MVAMIGAAAPASAQSIEDRINKLQTEIETLKQQLAEEKKARMADISVTRESPNKEIPVTRKNPDVELSISGQINRGVLYGDNGLDSDVQHVDNDLSSSRVRFEGKGKISDDITVGTLFEVEFESNTSSSTSLDDDGVDKGTNNFKQRKIELYFQSKKFGTVFLGQGSMATDGTVASDLSGTGIASAYDRNSTGGAIPFINSTTNVSTGVTLGSAMPELSGISRTDRIRYDTPSFGGFSVAVAEGIGGEWDGALYFGGKFSDIKVEAAGGYANSRSVSASLNGTFWGGSVSALHEPSGINLTLAGAKLKTDPVTTSDPSFIFAKVGYIGKWFPIGTTNLSFDWSSHSDSPAAGDEATVYSVGVVQNIKKVGTEIFLNLRWNDFDRTGTSTDGVFTTIGGARVKF